MKRALRVGSVCTLALALAGCAVDDIDGAAAQEWLTRVSNERADTPGTLGSGMGMTGSQESPVSATPEGITLASEQPTTVRIAEVLCFGGGTASVDIRVAGETFGRAVRADVACDEQPHRVQIGENGTPVSGVTSVTIDVRSAPATAFYADVFM